MEKCKVYLKSGNIIEAEFYDDEWEGICEDFLENKSVLIFDNCQVRTIEVEAIISY